MANGNGHHPQHPSRNEFPTNALRPERWTPVQTQRRKLVGQMYLRQTTEREITKALATAGEINPKTREPWSNTLIHDDVRILQALWRRDVYKDLETAKGQVLAEIR
ncbi:MAG: hypothetical protein Q8P59_09735, partial [Dehalococcoidia bacterium]|nr:hypothetical protein [Dehalococcoidia bacterium]